MRRRRVEGVGSPKLELTPPNNRSQGVEIDFLAYVKIGAPIALLTLVFGA
jgi:hypothetical protein